MSNLPKYAHLIAVPRGSVTEMEKQRVVKDFEAIGCSVVFLDFTVSALGVVPQIHVVVGEQQVTVHLREESDAE